MTGAFGQRIAIVQMHVKIAVGIGVMQRCDREPGHLQPTGHGVIAGPICQQCLNQIIHLGEVFGADIAGRKQALIVALQRSSQGDAAHCE